MSSKEDILKKYRANIREQYDMPDLSDIKAITYPDPLLQFMNMTKSVGGNAIEVEKGRNVNDLIRELYPEAQEIASNLPEITIATRNPDEVGRARDLNGTDVGIRSCRECLRMDSSDNEGESRDVHLREPRHSPPQDPDRQQYA